ncbi:MAG: ethanolamine ammonia-lyase subunit EutB [Bacteroidota bacterium]
MTYQHTVRGITYRFNDLKDLLAKASPFRTGDALAGISADKYEMRVAAQIALADVPLKDFLNELLIPYEQDEISRLIIDDHDQEAFKIISHFTIGEFRDWILSDDVSAELLKKIAFAVTPEMAAAVCKLMRNQDLIAVARKIRVITRFRTTLGTEGCFSSRLQPNHPTDDPRGIAASVVDGLLLGSGDAMIGINPATDSQAATLKLLLLMDRFRQQFEIPTQSCVLSHVTTTLDLINKNAPVDLCFQSIAGTEKANDSFGINLALLQEAYDATLSLKRNDAGSQVMYFETGQGSELSANAHHGIDQQTCEARSYAVARKFNPFLVNSVVGFIGPEYLYDGKQIIRAALEDHFCAKIMGIPMGVDVCYTNHAEADQDDMDNLLTLLGVAGCNFVMGVPGADDIMLNYQSTSFHDILYLRKALNLRPAPEFETWLYRQGIMEDSGIISTNGTKQLLGLINNSWQF